MIKNIDNIIPRLGISIFALFFSLGTFLQSCGMVILMVSLIFILVKKRSKTKTENLLLFSFPFFLYMAYWFFAYDKIEAADFLLRFSPVVIVSAVLIKAKEFIDINLFKKFYVLGTLFAILFCLLSAFWASGDNIVAPNKFFYYNFASYLSFHPTYLALIIISSLVFLNSGKLFKSYGFTICLSILFICALFLLQIRSSILLLLVLCLLQTFLFFKRDKKYLSLLSLGLIVIIVFSSVKHERFSILLTKDLNDKLGTQEDNGITQRIWLWKTALSKIKKSPVFGYGLRSQRNFFYKDVHKSLLAKKITFSERTSKILNAKKNLHNQYLQWLYDFGFFGLLCLLSYILLLFLKAQNNKNYLFITLLIIFTGMMITENLMDRQTGIYYFASVLPLIYFKDK